MNKNTSDTTKLTEEEMMQVKGGPAYIKIGDIKGEVFAPTSTSSTIRRQDSRR